MTTNQTPRGQTTHLGYAQIAGGFHATRYASARSRPMTHMVTINLNRLGVFEEDACEFFRELRSRVSRAWRYAVKTGKELGTFDYFHVHENPAQRTNVHWAVHIPIGHQAWFENLVSRRIEKLLGTELLAGALQFTIVKTPGGMAKYMLKGANPMFAAHFHLESWVANQGTVIGRRFGTSRSLGRTARKANWSRKKATS